MTLITLSYLFFPLLSRNLMHVLLLGFMSRAQESFTPFRLVLLSLQQFPCRAAALCEILEASLLAGEKQFLACDCSGGG